jgi:hypothetical protein
MIYRITGLIILLCLYALVSHAQDSLDLAYVQAENGQWQIINTKDEVVAKDLFEHDSLAVLNCNEGMAITERAGKFGFRNLFDSSTIANDFDTVTAFNNRHAAVRKGGQWFKIDHQGKTDAQSLPLSQLDAYLMPVANLVCKDGYCLVENDSFINCKGPDGKLILSPNDVFVAPWNDVNSFVFNRILKFRVMANKICSCQKMTNYYGFIDRKGNWMIEPAFEQADIFSCGLAAVSEGSENIYTFGYIDEKGEWMIKPVYKEAGRFMRIRKN